MSGLGIPSGGSSSTKRSFADAFRGHFVQANAAQLQVFRDLAGVDFNLDQTGWTPHAVQLHGFMELVDMANLGTNRPFLAPVTPPLDGRYSFEFLATTPMVIFVLEQDLSLSGHGLMVKIAGSSDTTQTLFPGSGLIINPPVGQFLVARRSTGPVMTALQVEINQVMIDHVTASTEPRTAAGGPTGTSSSGGSDCVKKATLSSVLDINGEVRVVYNKEGGNARMQQWAALIREWDPIRIKVFLGSDNNTSIEAIRDGMLSESERVMVLGEAMFSLARIDTILRLEAWKNPEAFRCFLLLDLPVSNWEHSFLDFKHQGSSAWTRDCDPEGLENLLWAAMNWGNFQRVVKGDLFQNVMEPVRTLWEDPVRYVQKYHNEFLHFQLEKMVRLYAQELTKTQGRTARLAGGVAGGLALGGQAESVAVLKWCVNEFVTVVRGGTLEPAPHVRFYGSEQYARIINRPTVRGAKGQGSSPGGEKGSGGKGDKPTATTTHTDGLCIWSIAGQLSMKNKKSELYTCRDMTLTHKLLKDVTQKTVLKLLDNTEFTAVCSQDALKSAIRAKVVAEAQHFKK